MANLSKIYSDLDLTFKKTPVTKDVALSYDDQAVIRSVRNLLSTAFYERLFQPNIGSNVNTILFEPIEQINASILENEIQITLRNYEPRVTINTINVSVLPDNNSYSAIKAGTYRLQVTDSNHCSAQSDSVRLTVNSLPPALILAAGSTSVCTGSNVLLNANIGIGLSYKWQKNGGLITGADAANYYASDSGAYRVIVTDTRTSCSNNSNKIAVTNRLTSKSSQTVILKTNYYWHGQRQRN